MSLLDMNLYRNAGCALAHHTDKITGKVAIPGDKSISHRALLLGLLANGITTVENLLQSEDVFATMSAIKALGATVKVSQGAPLVIHGVGPGALRTPKHPLNFGNSGTGARLTMGAVAGNPIKATFVGDPSLSTRPMERVLKPLRQIGAIIHDDDSLGHLPITITGADDPRPISYRCEVPSAQVKSAVLLAELNGSGITMVVEPEPTRDHTERMLAYFGADIEFSAENSKKGVITLKPPCRLVGKKVLVPGDPSSAAFPMVSALIVPNSEISIKNVMINPLRIGLITSLIEMGADLVIDNIRELSGEPIGDIHVRSSSLHAITVPAARAPSMIDEYPILAIAAACAQGTTRMCGLSELKVKESDRLSAIANGLLRCGIAAKIDGNDLLVTGGNIEGGAKIITKMDHRIAMAFLVLGLVSSRPVMIDDIKTISTSFPNFFEVMTKTGAKLERF